MLWQWDQVIRLLASWPAWVAMASALCLTLLGIEAINTVSPRYGEAQVRWFVVGLVAMFICLAPHPKQIGLSSYMLMAISLGLLLFLLIPGVPRWLVPVRNGARCWIDLQVMSFQPSEVAKVAYVLSIAWFLRHSESYRTISGILVLVLLSMVPIILILVEPDLGVALLFLPALFAMLVAAGARLSHLVTIVALAAMLAAVNVWAVCVLPDSMQILKFHQRNRIKAMVSQAMGDDRYKQDIGYQQHKAMTLIGAGGMSGYGAERAGTVIAFNRLPENHNDMIFVVIVNRWGLVGGLATLGLYAALVGSFLAIAAGHRDPFCRLFVVGLAGMLFVQMAINVSMTLGLLPITGITLPFVSYGGSSLMSCFGTLGLALNVASRQSQYLTRPSFEFDE